MLTLKELVSLMITLPHGKVEASGHQADLGAGGIRPSKSLTMHSNEGSVIHWKLSSGAHSAVSSERHPCRMTDMGPPIGSRADLGAYGIRPP